MQLALKADETVAKGECLPVSIAGQCLVLDPAGIAFLPDLSTLLVADLHLEKGSSFARRRQYLPPYDTHTTLRRLGKLVDRHQPKTIITLGDNFHDDAASQRLDDEATAMIEALAKSRTLIWLTGNHDPSPPDSLPGDAAEEMSIAGITLRHIAKSGFDQPEFSGHLHPAAKINVRGKSVRKPCFVSDGTRMIFPSFGAYTGGLNVKHAAFMGLFDDDKLCAYMLGSDRVYPMTGKRLV